MTLPFSLPAWLPWWVPLVLLVPALLYALLLLAMPFNVFGVKGRLDVLEARLDEIQGEIRSLTLRLPEPLRGGADFDDTGYAQPMAERDRARQRVPSRPPIPPRSPSIGEPYYGDEGEPPPARGRDAPGSSRTSRNEPRLGWPR
jgi:hypothetical protein